jgi:tripartite-type tricarboxylate transporter receptor subunit TctC
MAEAGYPEIAADIWTAVLVPAGTPRELVDRLNRAIASIVTQPETKERMAALGYAPVGNSPDECDAEIRTEMTKWAKVIRETGIKLQ